MPVNAQVPQLLAIREITGRIEAVLAWVPDAILLSEAEGTQLHLSSHTLDSEGNILVFDGPRALPCQGPEGNLCVLSLLIPDSPGLYHLQIEPVVEQRFWGAQRGYPPLLLDMHRSLDGSLLMDGFDLKQRSLAIDTPLYGMGDSERCIEIPWGVSRYRGESRVLDVGYANAEPRYVVARNALRIPTLVGLDVAAAPQAGILALAGDALAVPFAPGTFDLILAISVIEHIGRDNSVYFRRDHPPEEFGDLKAARILASLLHPGGRLLVTVPFGRLEDHGWFIQYDLRRITALVEATGCELTLAEYYWYESDGWHGPADPRGLSHIPYRRGSGAGAVACLEFTRRDSSGYERGADTYINSMQADNKTLSHALPPETARILKLSGAWTKMRGETGRMRPLMLFCETVNVCNADCVFCPYSSQTRPRGFMKSELFKTVLDEYCGIGGGHLTLTPMVGDALLDRNWMEHIRRLAGTPQIIPSITTNLYALDKFADDEVVEMLTVLHRIHISCYGITAEECESITRRRAFDRFLSQAQRLLHLRELSGVACDVRVGFRLVTPRSNEELENFLCHHLGRVVPFGATTTYANWGGAMHGTLPLQGSWAPPRTNESACIMLPLAVQVYWDGRVSACSCCDYDSSHELYLGNLNRQSLPDIFNGPESQAVWRAHAEGKLQRICRNCTFHVPLTALEWQHPVIQNPLDFIGG